MNSNSINLINSNSVVSDEESPMTAVKNSKNTSMWNCIHHQLEGKSDISISAGNTGVLLVISRMILKMMNDVSKPALAGLWPNQYGVNVVLDLGANIECSEQNLVDFAELGSALFKSLFPRIKPKVSLLFLIWTFSLASIASCKPSPHRRSGINLPVNSSIIMISLFLTI